MAPIPLMTPYKMGESLELAHRVVLAPLTRQRSYGNVPQPHAAVYYSQRATAGGFLISEATLVSDTAAAREYFGDVPGIWAPEHVDSWRPVVDAVHAKGAVFFCQLWHVPRRRRQEEKIMQQVSPQMSFDGRREELSSPRRVAAVDAPGVVECFRAAARNAVDAGFDGVEILGANAYFVSSSNAGAEDDDETGGGGIESSRSRIRFATEVISAVVGEVGAHRVGIRLDQFSSSTSGDLAAAGAGAEEEEDLALEIVERLNGYGVLYCHMIEPRVAGRRLGLSRRLAPFREAFGGTFIASGGYRREEGDRAVGEGYADLVAFGRLFLANPDLPRRFELDAPLNDCDKATFYGGGDPAVGYTDYPFLAS